MSIYWEHHEVLMEPEAPGVYSDRQLRLALGNRGWLARHDPRGRRHAQLLHRRRSARSRDPRRVIGRLRQPLLEPLDHERDGYVPNVVYSCGSLIHNGWLVVPYAVSDYATTHALAQLEPLERLIRQ